MTRSDQIFEARGGQLYDRDGQKVGKIDEIYLDTDSDQPEWALVNTGLFGSKSTFVPLRGAEVREGEIHVAYDKGLIKDAPGIDPDGDLSREEEDRLYRHYELDGGAAGDADAGAGYADRDSERRTPTAGTTDAGDRDVDGDTRERTTTADTTDDVERDATERTATGRTADAGDRDVRRGETAGDRGAMTRSEEELRVGTARRETGRARLRKWVETEEVTQTVPVTREEVRIEREPITDANRDDALAGPEISEAEHEVVLHEEEPVVEKQTVPKERIRLDKDVQTDDEQVSDEVRRERIDVDDRT
jgi:uncharacterized protein (TIGR02271 family)